MQVTRRAVGTAAVTAFICTNCASPGRTPDPSDGRSYPAVPEFDWPIPVCEVLVACTGRLQPEHVLKAFESGADLVLTISCDKDECRYLQGSERWTRRAEYVQTILDEVGLGGTRLRVFHMPSTAAANTVASGGQPEAVGEEAVDVRVAAIRQAVSQALDGLAPNPLSVEDVGGPAEEPCQQPDTGEETNED
jgi:coenzyme F420-reducing hydrogenase delta subunit